MREDSKIQYANIEISLQGLDYQRLLIEVSFVIMVCADSFKIGDADD